MTDEELLNAFFRHPDGSWSPKEPVSIAGVDFGPGSFVTEATHTHDDNLKQRLDAAARRHPDKVQEG